MRYGNGDEDEHPVVRVNIKTDEESVEESSNEGFQIKSTSQKSIKLAYEDILRLNLSTERTNLARKLYFHPKSLSFSSRYED